MKRARHSPYSPDLAPFDFFLFSSFSRMLIGDHGNSAGPGIPFQIAPPPDSSGNPEYRVFVIASVGREPELSDLEMVSAIVYATN
jgi:hypothetical protein